MCWFQKSYSFCLVSSVFVTEKVAFKPKIVIVTEKFYSKEQEMRNVKN